MANIGDQIVTPEAGWRRFLYSDPKIARRNGTWTSASDTNTYTNSYGAFAFLTFYGTKLRLLINPYTNQETNSRITVDGVDYTFNGNASGGSAVLAFEITGLEEKEHSVRITKMTNNTSTYMSLLGFDIDDTGYLTTDIGLQYTTPEAGWQRIDDKSPYFSFESADKWTYFSTLSGAYGGSQTYTNVTGSKLTFKFTGTKLRIFDQNNTNRSKLSTITIDGVSETYNGAPYAVTTGPITQTLIYEKENLPYGTHTVTIEKTESGTSTYFAFDCIDIDDNGKMEPLDDAHLPEPEVGWQRVDQNSSMIGYMGSGWTLNSAWANVNGGTENYTATVGNYAVFYFYGTKMRIIDAKWTNRDANIKVTVDDVPYYYNQYGTVGLVSCKAFEITGLNLGMHKVIIEKVTSDSQRVCIDAIDIDDTGYMMYQPFTQLTQAEAGWKRTEETDPSFAFGSNWVALTDAQQSGGRAMAGRYGGSVFAFKFKGTKFRIIGTTASSYTDKIKVIIDGEEVDYFSAYGDFLYQQVLYEKTGLEDKVHMIHVTTQIINKSISTYDYRVEAIDIDDTGEALSMTDSPIIALPEAGWKRIDDNVPEFGYINLNGARTTYISGNRNYNRTLSLGNGSTVDGREITFKFTGTKLRIFGYTSLPDTRGIYSITIDGVSYGEYYDISGNDRYIVLLFEETNLSDTIHTVSIKQKMDDKIISIDAIDIDENGTILPIARSLATTPFADYKRSENEEPMFDYRGTWSIVSQTSSYTGGNIRTTKDVGSSVSFKFKGTKFAIIDTVGTDRDKNIKITVDGVDYFYSSYNAYTIYKSIVFELRDLPDGMHNVTITKISNDTTVVGFDAVDVDVTGRVYHPLEVEKTSELTTIGNRIRMNYDITAANTIGKFGGLGQETMAFLPTKPSSATASGDFYLIYVDDERLPRRKKLLADRVIQGGISVDTLNDAGYATGTYLEEYYGLLVRLPYGGNVTADTDSEWDDYVVRSTLGGTITAGDNFIWNWSGQWSHTIGFYANGNNRAYRGATSAASMGSNTTSVLTMSTAGFRPMFVLEGNGDSSILGGNITIPERKESTLSAKIKVNGNNGIPYNYRDYVIDLDSTQSQYLQAPNQNVLPLSFTVEFWTYLKSYGNYARFFDFTPANSTTDIVLFGQQTTTGKLRFALNSGSSAVMDIVSASAIGLNEWVHLAVTYDYATGTATMYRNGEVVGTATSATKMKQVDRIYNYIGKSYSTAHAYLNAKLNEFRIWDGAKTQEEIKNLMGYKADGYESGLAHVWNFDVTTNYNIDPSVTKMVYDIVPNDPQHLSFYGGQYMTLEDMGFFSAKDLFVNAYAANRSNLKSHLKVTNAVVPYNYKDAWINLDNTKSQYLQAPSGNWLNGSWTVEFWTYVKSYTSWARFFDFSNDTAGTDAIVFSVSNGTTGKPTFIMRNGSTEIARVSTTDTMPLNTWVHLALSYNYDTNVVTLYKNGAVWLTSTLPAKIQPVERKFNYIGKSWSASDGYLNAKMNEFRIWDSVRTQDQIKDMMNVRVEGYEDNLVALWNFDLTDFKYANGEYITGTYVEGSTVYDITPNGNNLTFYGGTPVLEYDSIFYSGYDMYSDVYILYRNDLKSNIMVNPWAVMDVAVGIVPTEFYPFPATINIKKPSDLQSKIGVRPWGIMSMKIDVIPPPRTTVQLTSVKDAFVRSNVPRLNYGTSQDMIFGYDQANNEKYRSLIGFDLSSIPSGQRIEAAKLKLYFDYEPTDELELELCEVGEDWTELGVTWVNQPSVTNVVKTFKVGQTRGYIELDLLDKVNEWYKGTSTNNGFIIRAKDESVPLFYRFYTRESTLNKPYLEVRYYDPNPKSIDSSERTGSVIIRQSDDDDLKAKVQITTRYKEYPFPAKIHILNLNYMMEAFINVSRPDLTSKIKVRRKEKDEKAGSITVRQKWVEERVGSIFVLSPDIRSKIRVKQHDQKTIQAYIDVRRSNNDDRFKGSVSVSRPDLMSKMNIFYRSTIDGNIMVVASRDKTIGGKIAVRQSDEDILNAIIRVFKTDEISGSMFVVSPYFKGNITIPYEAFKEIKAFVKIDKFWASDLESKLRIGIKLDDAGYVFIL